jgi:hypothetical protein
MNRDDIIRMAHAAGFSDIIKKGVWITDGCWDEELERFAELVAAAEREECAKVCEQQKDYFITDGYPADPFMQPCVTKRLATPVDCAAAIRARGDL